MATPEEPRQSQATNGDELTVYKDPEVKWTDLPIARHKGRRPDFNLREILLHEDRTSRRDCQFDTIQQFLRKNFGYIIPGELADQFTQLQKWQFVVSTHVDVAQLLFLARRVNDTDSIPIDDAQATVYVHRGAEGMDRLDGGKYVATYLQLAGLLPDSNGDQRIVGIHYNRGYRGFDGNEAIAGGVSVSFAETEYERKPTPFDFLLSPIVDIGKHPWGIYLTSALTTKGMIDTLPTPHRRALSLTTHPKGGITIHQMGGKDTGQIDLDQGVSLSIKDKTVEVGLMKRIDGGAPWTLTIPRTLEPANPTKLLP